MASRRHLTRSRIWTARSCCEGENHAFRRGRGRCRKTREHIGGGPPFHPRCVHVLTPFVERLATEEERKAGLVSPGVPNG